MAKTAVRVGGWVGGQQLQATPPKQGCDDTFTRGAGEGGGRAGFSQEGSFPVACWYHHLPQESVSPGHRVSLPGCLGMAEGQRTGSLMPALTFLLVEGCVPFVPLASFSMLSVSFPKAHLPPPKLSHPWPTHTQGPIDPGVPPASGRRRVYAHKGSLATRVPGLRERFGMASVLVNPQAISCTQFTAVLNLRRGGESQNELKHNCPGIFSSTK